MIGALSLTFVAALLFAAPAPWPQGLGNHRALIRVEEKAEAVRAHIPWRRRDASPEKKDIAIVDGATGKRLEDVVRIEANREFGDLAFAPATVPGEYQVYYMPFTASTVPHAYSTRYTPPPEKDAADRAWIERNGLAPETIRDGRWKALPAAEYLGLESRTPFDSFDPMELIATAGEMAGLLDRNPGKAFLLFPEDREHPIRMTDDLPLRLIERGPGDRFRGEARRGEFFVFQVGLHAARTPIDHVTAKAGGLAAAGRKTIPASAIRCFNLGGIDWLGRPIRKTVSVPRGKVAALWFGIDVPLEADPGTYQGTLEIGAGGAGSSAIGLTLDVTSDELPDHGDGDLPRLARLRWLDSTLSLDEGPAAPYTPLEVEGRSVRCLGRELRFGDAGFPESIRSGAREVLSRAMRMVAEAPDGRTWASEGGAEVVRRAPGAVEWRSKGSCGPFDLSGEARMEYDGHVGFRINLRARESAKLKDLRLEIPVRRTSAAYLMGMGRKGGLRPEEWRWKWDVDRANNCLWIGEVDGGLYLKLKGPEDTWDLYNLRTSGIPESWGNSGRGGCTVSEEGTDTVLVSAASGERAVRAGEEITFRFAVLITPVKPLDPRHWSQRYYHAHVPVKTALDAGATIINIHHGNELNPHINYPFLAADRLASYVKEAHARGVKVKIYYTVRELSNRVAEMWALRSLGDEVFVPGGGGGHSWLEEHLGSGYSPAWHHTFAGGQVDAAIATVGLSRWHNYYLEGLRWLLRNVGIDGLYLDGIGYDREIMKRVRKVLDRERPGSLIDFHSGNNFHPEYGLSSCASQYLEHFPSIDSIWFGEGFDYNDSPDYWLVEVSGIPFGLFGEMLEGNGNPWRGMVFGMTARYYSGADPKDIWRLWDAFGIAGSRMFGWWSPVCPVRADRRDILATAYVKPGKTLVSIASWAREPARPRLRIDWEALGLERGRTTLEAPEIPGFQPRAEFRPDDEIPVQPGRGWLLILAEKPER